LVVVVVVVLVVLWLWLCSIVVVVDWCVVLLLAGKEGTGTWRISAESTSLWDSWKEVKPLVMSFSSKR